MNLRQPPNERDVLNAALDPRADLMVDISLLYACISRKNQHEFLNFLYRRYLRTRSDVYHRVDSRTLELDDRGWAMAVVWNIFREHEGHEGQSLLVPLDDLDTLCRCLTLRHLRTTRGQGNVVDELCLLVESDLRDLQRKCEGDRLMRIFKVGPRTWPPGRVWRRASRQVQPALQNFILQVADFLMETHGIAEAGSGRGEEILGPDGRLREGHPFVEHFQLRLPRFRPVCVFEVPARSKV